MFEFISSSAGGQMSEFGLGTPSTLSTITDRDAIFVINTSNNTASPSKIVNKGYYWASSQLDFYNRDEFSNPFKWAFSSTLTTSPSFEDLEVFTDRNNNKGWGGSIIQTISTDSWRLYMDDASSVDDDDNDIVIKVWVDTNAIPPALVPIPGAVWLLGSGLAGLIGLRMKKGTN